MELAIGEIVFGICWWSVDNTEPNSCNPCLKNKVLVFQICERFSFYMLNFNFITTPVPPPQLFRVLARKEYPFGENLLYQTYLGFQKAKFLARLWLESLIFYPI